MVWSVCILLICLIRNLFFWRESKPKSHQTCDQSTVQQHWKFLSIICCTLHFIIKRPTSFFYRVKPEHKDQPWDPEFVGIVDRWSLFRGSVILSNLECGCYRQMVAFLRGSLAQVWLQLKIIRRSSYKDFVTIFPCICWGWRKSKVWRHFWATRDTYKPTWVKKCVTSQIKCNHIQMFLLVFFIS